MAPSTLNEAGTVIMKVRERWGRFAPSVGSTGRGGRLLPSERPKPHLHLWSRYTLFILQDLQKNFQAEYAKARFVHLTGKARPANSALFSGLREHRRLSVSPIPLHHLRHRSMGRKTRPAELVDFICGWWLEPNCVAQWTRRHDRLSCEQRHVANHARIWPQLLELLTRNLPSCRVTASPA